MSTARKTSAGKTSVGARREWSRHSRNAALRLAPTLLDEALANTRRAGDPIALAVMAREIAVTRGPELARAYKNVVMVVSGYRRRRSGAVAELTDEPCVVFVVRRKWVGGEQGSDPIPEWLVAHDVRDGVRRPFAIATDVREETAFFGARTHRDGAVWLDPRPLRQTNGAVACGVELRHPGGVETCLLSARHVFTPWPEVDTVDSTGGMPVLPYDHQRRPLNAPTVASTAAWGGILHGDEDPDHVSFDVQLARLEDGALDQARAIVGAAPLSDDEPYATTHERLLQLDRQAGLLVMVPGNNPLAHADRAPMRARVDVTLDAPYAIQYEVRVGGAFTTRWIFQAGLFTLKMEAGVFPVEGDSGSAVVVPRDDGTVTLAGLYIAGNDQSAFVIPAWQLFEVGRYASLPEGARLRPVDL